MERRILVVILLSMSACLFPDGSIAGTNRTVPQEKTHTSPPKSPFRYVITRNQITEVARYPVGGRLRSRGVDVVLDAKAFSEGTLRQLTELLSKRFPDPDELLVSVYTNLDDVLTPEEAEIIPPPGTPIDLSAPTSAWAFYVRNSESEHFSYHTKEPGSVVRTVNLRGKEK
jgi:hypothetical protein